MDRDLELLYEVGTLRSLQRTWQQFFSSADFATIPEHTFRVAWLALVIAKHEGQGDAGKIALMALVHDLPESRTGDVNYLSRMYTKRDENKAIADSLAGTSLQDDMAALYEEYEQRESIEAHIVKDADILDVDMEIHEQSSQGIPTEDWREANRRDVAKRLKTKTAKRLWEKIYESRPHDWHLNAQNRYKSGDYR